MAKPYGKQELEALVCEVMDISAITPTIRKQITNFVLIDHMSWKEIARCIVWYQEVFHGKFEPIYGLSFVPSVKDRAAKYFKQLELEQQKKSAEAQKIIKNQENNIVFNIKSLKHKKRKARELDISEINVEGESNND